MPLRNEVAAIRGKCSISGRCWGELHLLVMVRLDSKLRPLSIKLTGSSHKEMIIAETRGEYNQRYRMFSSEPIERGTRQPAGNRSVDGYRWQDIGRGNKIMISDTHSPSWSSDIEAQTRKTTSRKWVREARRDTEMEVKRWCYGKGDTLMHNSMTIRALMSALNHEEDLRSCEGGRHAPPPGEK